MNLLSYLGDIGIVCFLEMVVLVYELAILITESNKD